MIALALELLLKTKNKEIILKDTNSESSRYYKLWKL